MDVLKRWKFQRGKGTYISEDTKDTIKVVSYLIDNIKKLNNNIVCFASHNRTERYSFDLGLTVRSYESAILPRPETFLLILLDIDFVPKDVLSIIVNANPHKYLFCTSSTTEISKYHIQIAPIILLQEPEKVERRITSSGRILYNIALDLITDDQKIYDTYTEKMNDIFSFFGGDMYVINSCYRGDQNKNITADVFRREFAHRNNWNDHLDTSIEYYKEIDHHYNPNSIFEKAKIYFDLLANRNHFVDEHGDKSYFVHKLIAYHSSTRFVIVCKNNYMADKVQNMLDKNNKCRSRAIHNDLAPVNFRDESGSLISYKTGSKKGQPKEFGSKYQTDTYVQWFNRKLISVIVCTGAVQKDIVLDHVDCIVYLSPRCISYEELQKRITINFTSNTNIVNVYFSATKDEDALTNNQRSSKHTARYYYKGDIGKLRFE